MLISLHFVDHQQKLAKWVHVLLVFAHQQRFLRL
jgi:hypothetical protein